MKYKKNKKTGKVEYTRVWSIYDCKEKKYEFFYRIRAAKMRALQLVKEHCKVFGISEDHIGTFQEYLAKIQGSSGNNYIRFIFSEHDNIEKIKAKGFEIKE